MHLKMMNIHNDIIKNEELPLGDAIMLQQGVPGIDCADSDMKLRWLNCQIIGQDVDIQTIFGKRKLTYADHTASGRSLRYIEDYIMENVLPFYGNTHTSDSYVGDRTTKIFNEATEYVKKSLGGTQDDALLFCGSGTTASIKRLQEVMGIAISPILKERVVNSCLATEERWVVFVGPYEHHSNLLSWRQSLAEVVDIGLDDEGLINLDDLQLKLEFYQGTGRPMLGSFSACSNVTGICSDTRSLSRLLHQFGAFACFDFASSGPYVEIDMRSDTVDGYDAIVLSPHKFLGGPGSPGILLLSKALYQLKNYSPSTCGGGTVSYVNLFSEHTLYINDIEEREDAGTPQIIQRIKAALAFQVKEYIGFKTIAEKERDYVGRALDRLTKNQNIRVLGNTKAERQAIISFLVYSNVASSDTADNKKEKPLHGAFVATLLNDLFGIQARGGCACAGPYGHYLLGIDETQSLAIRSAVEMGYNGAKLGWTRISFPYYMSNEEYEFILAAIEFICIYGERFLLLYLFNWNTGSWKINTNAFEEANLPKEKICKLCASFSTKELKVIQVNKENDSNSQKLIGCKTTDDHINDHLGKYAFYLEVAKHIGELLPYFPSECTHIPKDIINPNNVLFRI